MLHIRVDSNVHLLTDELKATGIRPKSLLDSFTHDNPNYHKKRALGYWTGNDEPRISLGILTRSHLTLPRGAWRRLAAVFEKMGLRYRLSNLAACGTNERGLRMHHEPPFKLRQDQISAVGACISGKQGVVVAPCGAGKTTIAARFISEVNEKTLVLVHTEALLDQWVGIVRAHLGITPGMYYGKSKTDGQVVVGMMQSVVKIRDRSWFGGFGAVIVDEAHHSPCQTMAKIVSQCPAKYRIGLTATPKRKDGMQFLMWDLFGWDLDAKGKAIPRVLHKTTDAGLNATRSVMPVDVVVVPTEYEYDGDFRDPGQYSRMLDDLSGDPDRLKLALGLIMREVKMGKRCLVLADRRALCVRVHCTLSQMGVAAGLMMGGPYDKADAAATIAGLRDGSVQVGIGTTIADEGLDVRELDCGFGLTPSASNPGRFTQQFGRIKRKADGKESATYYYLWDRRIGQFARHASYIQRAVEPPHRSWYLKPGGQWAPLVSEI